MRSTKPLAQDQALKERNGTVIETSTPVTSTPTVTWRESLFTPYHVIQPSGSISSLRDQCFFYIVHVVVEFCYSLGFGTTGDSRHHKQVASGSYTPPVLFTRVHPPSFVEPESNTLSRLHKCNIHILVKLSRSQWPSVWTDEEQEPPWKPEALNKRCKEIQKRSAERQCGQSSRTTTASNMRMAEKVSQLVHSWKSMD